MAKVAGTLNGFELCSSGWCRDRQSALLDLTGLNIVGQKYTEIQCKTNLHYCGAEVHRNSVQNRFTLSGLDWTGLVSCGVIEIHRDSVQNKLVSLRRLELFSVSVAYVCFFARCHFVDKSDYMQIVRLLGQVVEASQGPALHIEGWSKGP
jgi:hypothetical protein